MLTTPFRHIWRWGLPLSVLIFILLALATFRAQGSDAPTRRVNAPYFADGVASDQAAVFWFGQVNNTSNHANVRIGYDDDQLVLNLHAFDRWLWYDTDPTTAALDQWDAASFYLQLEGNTGAAPTTQTYRFVAQINHFQARDDYQALFQWNGSSWEAVTLPFTTTTGWRATGLNDNGDDDRGWHVKFKIPFSSLGLSGAPAEGTVWGLGVVLHDRDEATNDAVPDTVWPETFQAQQPATWGQLHFGESSYDPPHAAPSGTTTIRQGLNGAQVPDGHVGGQTTCGDDFHPNYFASWGDANYAGDTQINVQNQWDVADWPCFSKYYVTFPLDGLPAEKEIISATLTLHQFGNANGNEATPSLIQVLTVDESWDEGTLTWNNAPLAVENISASWVGVLTSFPGWPGIPRSWDVSKAVAEAYAAGEPVRLALYSADGDYHSGKYFSSSDVGEWTAESRPTLTITWGEGAFSMAAAPAVRPIAAGESGTFTVTVTHGAGFETAVALSATNPAPDDLDLNFSPSTIAAPGGQSTLTITDKGSNAGGQGQLYAIPITAAGGDVTQTQTVYVLLNGSQTFLPLMYK